MQRKLNIEVFRQAQMKYSSELQPIDTTSRPACTKPNVEPTPTVKAATLD